MTLKPFGMISERGVVFGLNRTKNQQTIFQIKSTEFMATSFLGQSIFAKQLEHFESSRSVTSCIIQSIFVGNALHMLHHGIRSAKIQPTLQVNFVFFQDDSYYCQRFTSESITLHHNLNSFDAFFSLAIAKINFDEFSLLIYHANYRWSVNTIEEKT